MRGSGEPLRPPKALLPHRHSRDAHVKQLQCPALGRHAVGPPPRRRTRLRAGAVGVSDLPASTASRAVHSRNPSFLICEMGPMISSPPRLVVRVKLSEAGFLGRRKRRLGRGAPPHLASTKSEPSDPPSCLQPHRHFRLPASTGQGGAEVDTRRVLLGCQARENNMEKGS